MPRITVEFPLADKERQFGTPGAPAGPEIDAPQPRDWTQDDFEPPLLRRQADLTQFLTARRAVEQAGDDPEAMFAAMADTGTLGPNIAAQRDVERVKARKSWLETWGIAGPEAERTNAEAGALLSDLGRGVLESPKQIIGGVRDAVQSAAELGDWLVKNAIPLAAFPAAMAGVEAPTLPEIGEAKTITGAAARVISQFLTGFGPAGGALAGFAKAAPITRAAIQGALADFAAFGPHQKRLSDMVQQFPALQNPVTEYLAADPADSQIEGRLKNTIEGLGLGVVAEGVFRGVRAIRDAGRAAAEAPEAPGRAAAAVPEPRPAASLDLLGDTEAPLVSRDKRRAEKMARAEREAAAVGDEEIAARALTPKGLTPLGGKRDVFVNFARIDTQADVKRVIADTADAFKSEIDSVRRGVRPNIETMEAAREIDAWETLMQRRQGAPLNAEESVAARQLWAASGQKLMEIARVAAANPSPENLFQFRRMLATHHAIQSEVIASRTETARALQSWRIPAGAPREQLLAIERELDRTGGAEVNTVLAARIAALRDVPNGLAALDDVVEKTVLGRSLDAVKEFWVNALLSGMKTHVVNTVSNTAIAAQQVVERFGAGLYSRALGSGEIPLAEAAAQSVGMMNAIRDAFRYAGKTFMTGEVGFGLGKTELPFDRAISAENFKIAADSWLAKGIDALGAVINVPGRAMLAEDEFFKTMGRRGELYAQAYRIASREALDGKITAAEIKTRMADIIAAPPEHLSIRANEAAAYQTLTTQPGATVKAINRLEAELASHGVGGQLGGFLLRFTLPFRNTPANILKYTFERTPLAPLTQRYREAVAQGGATADIARTRMALGTMTILAMTDLALDGYLTGTGPSYTDPARRGERQALLRSGWQPYSVKVGDRYFAYNRMDPIGFTIGIGADLAEAIGRVDLSGKTGVEIEKAFAAAAFSIGNNVLNKSYMRGLAEFVSALMDPERQAGKYMERSAGSFMPTGVADIARSVDPQMRFTHDMISRLMSRTPGLTTTLPVARDIWGRPRSFESGLGPLYDTVSPIYSRREDVQPIDREMFDQVWFLGMPTKRIAGVSLTNRPEVFSRFLELQGQTPAAALGDAKLVERYGDRSLLDTLNGLVTGAHPLAKEYQALEKGEARRDFVKKIVGAYRRAARKRVVEEFPKVFSVPADEE